VNIVARFIKNKIQPIIYKHLSIRYWN